MSIDLKVYDNGDHTCLVWLPADEKPIPGCRGFVVRRILNGKEDYLHGAVGFTADQKLGPAPSDGVTAAKFPIQRFLWWDYYVKPDDTVQYSVVPVVGPDKDHLALAANLASPLTSQMTITGQCTPHLSVYFNKGIVASQWVSRELDDLAKDPRNKDLKIKDLVAEPGNDLRNGLSGLLRPQVLSLLEDAKKSNGKIYAALYELNDKELIPGLVALGQNCNLILANGAFKPPDNDENKDVRAQLKSQIRVYDRIVGSPHFGHNKFVVFCDADGKPQKVLTGSTNWTSSGLCTQANNGLIIDDANVAQDFLDAWNRIHAAGNAYPPSLAAANSTSSSYQVDGCKVTPWFVPTQHAQDLDYARKLINAAKEGILFLFFNPGGFEPDATPEKWTLLQNILNRHHEENNAYYDPNLYIKGVVNQEIPYLTEPPIKGKKPPAASMDPTMPTPHAVAVYTSGIEPPQRLTHDVLVPANIKENFGAWEKELLGASMVNIHSKCIVLDPYGANPVVMTGSHNLGFKASSENDDNLVIIEGNASLASAYAVNIIAIYHTYRWNSYVNAHRQDPNVWHGPKDSDQWQASYLQGDQLADLQFWFGEGPATAPTATAAAAPTAVPAKAMAVAAGTGTGTTLVSSTSSGTAAATAPVTPIVPSQSARRRINSVSTGGHHRRHSGPVGAPVPSVIKAPAAAEPLTGKVVKTVKPVKAVLASGRKPQPGKRKK